MIQVNNGKITKYITPESIDEYLDDIKMLTRHAMYREYFQYGKTNGMLLRNWRIKGKRSER